MTREIIIGVNWVWLPLESCRVRRIWLPVGTADVLPTFREWLIDRRDCGNAVDAGDEVPDRNDRPVDRPTRPANRHDQTGHDNDRWHFSDRRWPDTKVKTNGKRLDNFGLKRRTGGRDFHRPTSNCWFSTFPDIVSATLPSTRRRNTRWNGPFHWLDGRKVSNSLNVSNKFANLHSIGRKTFRKSFLLPTTPFLLQTDAITT